MEFKIRKVTKYTNSPDGNMNEETYTKGVKGET
jgi:hypothetical protein